MGFLFSSPKPKLDQKVTSSQAKIQNVDIIKVKLKQARDKIKQYINMKNKDLQAIDTKIQQSLPEYKQTKNKKKMIPLLQAKRDLQKMIDNADVRLKLVNQSLSDVQIQELNKKTVDALDQSNKYIKQIVQELQAKDWQNVLQQAQQKYQLDWPEDQQNLQEDQTFQEMWKQLGGDKIQQKGKKIIEKKKVNVQTYKQHQKHQHHEQKQLNLA